ncbi:MAG: response regulator [Vicinamibacteria bacterium]|jgi:PAS domain S-box-containing protein|nr:response regulator [Vicinamibacteria bacterium]
MRDSPGDILLVEDDEDHAELIRRSFEASGSAPQIDVVRTLAAARARLAEWPPDLVITDLRLPDGSGAELIAVDREQARYPVVVMTSFGDQHVAVEAMRSGALDYVIKSGTTFQEMPRIAERAYGLWRHIVERRRAEAGLRESERHFRSLIENALDLILVVEPDGRMRYASPSSRRVLGWEAEGLIGRDGRELVHPDDLEAAVRMFTAASQAVGTPNFGVLRLRGEDGLWRDVEVIGQATTDGAVVVNARDISERLRAEEARRALEAQLRQSQRLETLGTLAGGIAHDFNNILQAILGCTELARGRLAGDDAARRYLDRTLEVGRRATDLVRQILQFSRQGEQRLAPVALRPLLEEVARLLRATLPKSIELRTQVDAEIVVTADTSQLHQVLMNLATNAAQALGERTGVLELKLERQSALAADEARPDLLAGAPHAVITVSDDGPGIPEEIRERVFEPFFTTKAAGQGTGLGLSVAHGIVRSHGGSLRLLSGPGGTTFRIYLPVPVATATLAASAAGAPTATATRGHALLVDDDPNVAFATAGLLEQLGLRVTTCHGGVDALELFGRQPEAFDLAIVDEAMPRMTGSQLRSELRRLRPRLPIIVVSGHGLPAGALFDDAEDVRYLAKPFGAVELAEAVRLSLSSAAAAAAGPAGSPGSGHSPGA